MGAPFTGDGAVSSLFIGEKWLTAKATITLGGKTAKVTRRLSVRENDVPSRRRLLQNTYYEAAMQFIAPPKWGSLSGVRPTKLTTRHLLAGGDEKSAEKLMRQRYSSPRSASVWRWSVPEPPFGRLNSSGKMTSASMWASPSAPPVAAIAALSPGISPAAPSS